MLELESHLARGRRRAESLEVGDPVVIALDPSVDGIEVDFLVPPDGTLVHQAAAGSREDGGPARHPDRRGLRRPLAAHRRVGAGAAVCGERRSGRGASGPVRTGGARKTLAGVPFTYENAASIDPGARALAGVSLVTPLLTILLGILLLEQLVAWSSSYHPLRRRGAAT